mmetsp:Transcript_38187/g.64041  ORF Transcript_38187/g.64041 Transcript_38187/m.64041 type:complete len:324 (-) Transcript_38187:13-984(-)
MNEVGEQTASRTDDNNNSLREVKADVLAWAKVSHKAMEIQSAREEAKQSPLSADTLLQQFKMLPERFRKMINYDIEAEGGYGGEDVTPLLEACQDVIIENGLERGESLWLPEFRLPSSQNSIPSDWEKFASQFGFPSPQDPNNLPEWCVSSISLSYVVTAALAVKYSQKMAKGSKFSSSSENDKTFILDILGPEESEISWENKWLGLLALFPSLNRLKIRMVGPSIDESLNGRTTSMTCAFNKRPHSPNADDRKTGEEDKVEIQIQYFRQLYHEFAVGAGAPTNDPKTASFDLPDAVVAFASGLSEHLSDWLPTLKYLLEQRK